MHRFILLITFICLALATPAQNYRFRRITYQDGLSDNLVSCIYKSSNGFVWIGTQLGLNRYDGIRLRRFFSTPGDDKSLPDNNILSIDEDAQGKLWVRTPMGICIFDPSTELVDRDVNGWMKKRDITGKVNLVRGDKDHNLWIVTYDQGIWFYDFKTNKATHVLMQSQLPSGTISGITVFGTVAIITYNNGLTAGVGREHKNLMWTADYIVKNRRDTQPHEFKSFVDSRHNIWVFNGGIPFVYVNATHKWMSLPNYYVYDVSEDKNNNILLATDHDGIAVLNAKFQQISQMTNILFDENSIPDNTVECLFVDNTGIVWAGTYRMGVAFYYSGRTMATTIPLGDVNALVKDKNGWLWAGTNNAGIECYNLYTGQTVTYGRSQTGLGSDVLVSLLATRDGSIYAGSFQGGMTRYKNGQWTSWKATPGGLADNSVWSLAELSDGRIAIGTLQNGLQIYNPWTGKFITFNTNNSSLPSNYIPSLSYDRKHNLLYIGHSSTFSVLNLKTMKISNFTQKGIEEGEYFSSNNFNQIYVDSRGLIWAATTAGLNVYDPKTKYISTIQLMGNRKHSDVSSITEGKDGRMWAATTNSVHAIKVTKGENGWSFMVNYYGKSDGFNNRVFNRRSILCTSDGCILFGGIDGVNLIDAHKFTKNVLTPKVVFSDIAVFGNIVHVSQEFDGHVILKNRINDTHEVSLSSHQNTVTIYLATNEPGQFDQPRFLYRLEDYGDKWLMTPENDPSVNFTDLSYGKHTLQVRLVDHAGYPMKDIATMTINIRPPFYLSVWALIIYSLLILAGLWVAYKYKERQKDAKKSQQDLDKEKEVDQVKMRFFTTTSNELRTPLTLIITPLHSIMEEESNPGIARRLKIVENNAKKLMRMIDQMLDLRRLLTDKEKVNTVRQNIVPIIREACGNIYELEDKKMHLTFRSDAKLIIMDVDSEKINSMVSNLVVDSYRFTPEEGRINIDVNVSKDARTLEIKIADSGIGISDKDKEHIFDRFYMGNDKKLGAVEGAGLNLVWEYAKMLGGSVVVTDNIGGGTVFTITLPMKEGIVNGAPVLVKFDELVKEEEKREAEKLAEEKHSVDVHSDSNIEERPVKQVIMSDSHEKVVLLASDDADTLNLLSLELAPRYTILTARDGKEAMLMVSLKKPDLIITDSVMPKLSGLDLCRALKSKDETKDIPIMLLSVHLPDKTDEDLKKMGFADFIFKPFNMNYLKKRVKEMLSRGR